MKNHFITIEGIEGAGKSSAIEFIAEHLRNKNIDFILTREPGGSQIAEVIRKVLLDHYPEKMHPDTEMLLYFAARAQHLHQTIIPALKRGQWVICDRFTDTTYAYQGGGRGIPKQKIAILEQWVQDDLRPDYTLLLDVDVEIGKNRIKNRTLDRLEVEKDDFFVKIRTSYLELANLEPSRFYVVDANSPQPEVFDQLTSFLNKIT